MFRSGLHSVPCLALAAVAGHVTPVSSFAQDYNVSHTFTITTPGDVAPLVYMVYSAHVRARTNACNDTVGIDKDKSGATSADPLTRTAVSAAPDSNGTASCDASIDVLFPGFVSGSFSASGFALPKLSGCAPPVPPKGYGRVHCWSATKVVVRGQKKDRNGRTVTTGGWHSTETISGSSFKTVGHDPVRAKLIDLTTGITTEYELLSVDWAVGGGTGSFDWDGVNLSSSAPDLDLSIDMTSPVTVQQGTVRFKVRGGTVTQSDTTGVFAAMGLPPVGGLGAFSIPFAEITMDYNLGGDETHDLETELTLDNGGHVEKVITGDGQEQVGTCVVTGIGTGPGGANLSEIAAPDTTMGYLCSMPMARCARLLPVTGEIPIELTALSLTSYGATPTAAYARVWAGIPGASALIAGDLVTNRIVDVESADAFRVRAGNPLDASRPLKNVYIDLTWVPALPPGQYWIEFATAAQTPGAQTYAIQSPWETHTQDSMVFDTQLNQWRPTYDQGSGRPTTLATYTYYSHVGAQACYANCDNSQQAPILNVGDFTCFLQKYALGDSYANCDGSQQPPVLNVGDFTCFLQKFALGCGH